MASQNNYTTARAKQGKTISLKFDFSPISLPYFPILCKLANFDLVKWSVSAPVRFLIRFY